VTQVARLHAAGWTFGDVAVHGESGLVWIVTGTNGKNRIEARGDSQDEAWRNAVAAHPTGFVVRIAALCPPLESSLPQTASDRRYQYGGRSQL
jgi:hypothetical protein